MACEKRGVKVFNAPGVNIGAVAEMILVLAISIVREILLLIRR